MMSSDHSATGSPGAHTRGVVAILLPILIGIVAGLGLYTADHAEAMSYLSNDPAACVNCHVMREEFDAWAKGAHHAQTCNDCHVPQDLVGKYYTKAEHGYRHSKGFTLMDFKEPIRITPGSLAVVQDNCVRCHEGLVGDIGAARHVPAREGELDGGCVHCHAGVGHGPGR